MGHGMPRPGPCPDSGCPPHGMCACHVRRTQASRQAGPCHIRRTSRRTQRSVSALSGILPSSQDPKARQRPARGSIRRDALSLSLQPLPLSNTMGLFGLPLSGSPPKIRCSIHSTATLGQPSQNCIRFRLDGCTAASEAEASGRAVKNRGEKDKGARFDLLPAFAMHVNDARRRIDQTVGCLVRARRHGGGAASRSQQ